MHHTFEFLNKPYLFDVESCSLHGLDAVAFAALNDEAAARAQYGGAPVDEALADLGELRAAGALDAPEPSPPAVLERPVKAMCLHVAHDCDLRCAYCFAGTGSFSGARALLPLETGKKALDWLVSASGGREMLEVDFFGGEPLLNFGVVKELVAYGRALERAHNKRISFTLTTNGLKLTPDIVSFCNDEISNVVLSLDGRGRVHDRARKTADGRDSFGLVAGKIADFAASRERLGLEYYVRGTYTACNLDFAEDALFLFDMGIKNISLEPVVLPSSHPMAIREEHISGLISQYDALAEAYLARRKAGESVYFFHFHADLSGGPCLAKRVSGCGAGNEYAAVTPEGGIFPCHQFAGNEAFKLGNVFDGALEPALRDVMVNTTLYSKPECRACWAKYLCGGGCMASAHKLTGSLSAPDPIACALQKKRLECALGVLAEECV